MKQTCKIAIDPKTAILALIPIYGFIHGGYFGGERMVNVIYLDEINTGSIVVTSMTDQNTVMMRFTGQRVRRPTEPSLN